jgi:type I restriction enzyme, S subunit
MMKINNQSLATACLKDLCLLVTDGTHDSPKLQKTGVPFIKGKHISGGYIDFENCDHITHEDHLKVISRSKPEKGDILFSNIGSVGDTAYIKTREEFSIKNVALFKPNPSIIDNRYLYYKLKDPRFKSGLLIKRSGAAQPFLGLDTLRKHIVTYHSEIHTQQKIVSILSAYDDLIENNTRRIAILEEMAQMIYREWFVMFRFPGHEKVKMVDSPLGKIPEGWEVKKVGDILQNIGRRKKIKKQEFSSEGQFPIVDQSADFIGGYTDDFNAVNDEPLPLIVFGDHTRVLKFIDFPFVCGADGTQLLYPSCKEISPEYFYFSLCQIDLSNFGYARHFKFLKEKFMLIPEKDLLQQFQKFAFNALKKSSLLKTKNKILRQTRDLLLPKLISGELDVSDLDIEILGSDEPELQASAGGIK